MTPYQIGFRDAELGNDCSPFLRFNEDEDGQTFDGIDLYIEEYEQGYRDGKIYVNTELYS